MRFLIADSSSVVRSALRLLLEHHFAEAEILEATSVTDVACVIARDTKDAAKADAIRAGVAKEDIAKASALEASVSGENAFLDYAFIDWGLPPDGGRTAIQQIHARDPHVRVIVLSGRPEIESEACKAGAVAFVSKGEPPDRLLAVLRRLTPSPPSTAPRASGGICDITESHAHTYEPDNTRQSVSIRNLAPLGV